MMSFSPDPIGHNSEPMTVGTPTSPASPVAHQSQYLPSFLLGESMSHVPSPMSSRLWSGSGGSSPPRSGSRQMTFISPNSSLQQFSTPRMDTSIRGKDKASAPPIRSLLQTTSPSQSAINSPFSTPSQYPQSRNSGLSTPAPPTIGLNHSRQETVFGGDTSCYGTPRIPTSPAQLDPFYTQGEALTPDDVLDETWVTVFGFPPPAVSYVLQQFSQYGNILKHVMCSEGNWMHIHYQSKIQAKKALSKNGKVIGNNIMVGVSHCIDKSIMEMDKENEDASFNQSVFGTPNSSLIAGTGAGQIRGTPIRPLTAAYKAARSEHEVLQNNQAARKNSGILSKAMEYMFGW